MLELINILLNVISPIFIVLGVAYALGRRTRPDPRTLSIFLIYVFVPALSFNGLFHAELGGDFLGLIGVTVGVVCVMVVLGWALGRWLRLEARQRGSLIMTLFMINGANYGTPVNTFAYGALGGQFAVVYYVVNSVLSNFLGVFFASQGSVPIRRALLNALSVPIGYAALLGLALNVLQVEIPLFLGRGIDILAQASIPCMLALLGLQLTQMQLDPRRLRLILLAAVVRLVGGALIALPLCVLFGVQGVAFQVAITQSAMPTAVMTNALAAEFGGDVEFTSAMTLVSTLLSIISLSVLIALLS